MSRRSSEDHAPHVPTSRRGSEDSRRSSTDQPLVSSRRVSIGHPEHLPTPLEIQLLYGYFTDLSAQKQRETSRDLWQSRETFERQLNVVRCVFENNAERTALLLRMSIPTLIDAAIKAAAYENNIVLISELHKKTADRSAAVFGFALGGHFDQVHAIFAKCRLKMSEGISAERLHYADLLTAAAAGAAIRGDSALVVNYQREGAHLFQIAMAYGLVNNELAYKALYKNNPPYKHDMKKAALMGFAMGDHYDAASRISRDFTQYTDAIVFGLGVRNTTNSDLARVFSNIAISLPCRLLGYLLGGHVMRVEELRDRLSDDTSFHFVLSHLALFSGRSGYANHLAQEYSIDLSQKIGDFNIALLLRMGVSDDPMEAPERLRRNSRRVSESTEVLDHSQAAESVPSARRDSHPSQRGPALFQSVEVSDTRHDSKSSVPTLPPIDPRHVRFR